jgi:site-specific DNA-methyltransferase (adenine-specific)
MSHASGRWPANVLFDEEAAAQLDASTPATPSRFFYVAKTSTKERNAGLDGLPAGARPLGISNWSGQTNGSGKTMGPSAPQANTHPTVKPIALMRYLVRLVTPPGGVVLDPFLGSGSTACAAVLEGFDYIGMEMDATYADIAEARITHWKKEAE